MTSATLEDENDMDVLQARAEFGDAVCDYCGGPLALDGVCDYCADFCDDGATDWEPEDDEFLIDPAADEGGEA